MPWKKKAALLSALLLLLQSPSLHAEALPPTLGVKGYATIRKPADELQINIGVISRGKTAESALKKNSADMRNLTESLIGAGLVHGEYKTGYFSIRPIYSERPKNAPQDWEPEIIAYEVSNSLSLRTDKIKLAGPLIDAAAKSGANNINNINFGLKDPQMYRGDAITAATKNALADAQALSKAAGVNLVRIRTISLDDANVPPPAPRGMLFAKAMAESVPIEAGDVEVSASVTVFYEID